MLQPCFPLFSGMRKTMVKEFFEKKCSTIGLGQLLWRDSKIQLPFSKIDVTFDRKIVPSWLTTHLRAGNMSYNFYINTMGRFSSELWKFFRSLTYIWNFFPNLDKDHWFWPSYHGQIEKLSLKNFRITIPAFYLYIDHGLDH